MNLKNYIQLDDNQLGRLEDLYARYKKMYLDPDNCFPMFILRVPVKGQPAWEEMLADPLVMLKAQLDDIRQHLEMEDDMAPMVRVNFGTAQIAAAFGCEMFIPKNNLPAAGSHILKNAGDVYKFKKPSLEAGWYGKLKNFTGVFLENLPEGINIQHPDIQSAFNSAHLIRGNDILLDFFDDPDALDTLLDLVTDYMIDLVPYLKNMISNDREWFFDWGSLWKGCARISNCSMHMISPEFYQKHVLPRDMRLMEAIGGGRIHYCGTADKVIDGFFENPNITGLDYDLKHHDFWHMCRRAPRRTVLCQHVYTDSTTGKRLLSGDWPEKKNIIITLSASSIDEGKELMKRFKESVPY